ncbi:MAG TPA: DUF2344 domain-containing protein [Desulfotomaculum sp.]|nr:DUF2344 domain-containing protein [Desulfotomaculum sp.]
MPRYRIEFKKDGPARYISHLDLVRTLERVMRRAGLPLAFSRGFNPHPRFSLGAPLPVGVRGEREYLDLELAGDLPAVEVQRRLADKLPPGLAVTGVWPVPPGAPALMATLQGATYRVAAPLAGDLPAWDLQHLLQEFLAAPEIIVCRKTKDGGEKNVDIRPGIRALSGRVEDERVVLEMDLQAGSRGNVRPEEVVRALAERGGLPVLVEEMDITRTGLYPVEMDRDGRRVM